MVTLCSDGIGVNCLCWLLRDAGRNNQWGTCNTDTVCSPSGTYPVGLQPGHRFPRRRVAAVYRGDERTAADVAVLIQRSSLRSGELCKILPKCYSCFWLQRIS